MIVRIINVYVSEKYLEAFKEVSVKNRLGSIREPGVVRFDILQNTSEPTHFVLCEVYENEQAAGDHKETAHYREWRDAVEPMMSRPRQGIACAAISPADCAEWRSRC